MKTMRQDAWTSDDDVVLAEIVLRHIREGSTQLVAFEQAAEKLGRTSAACGYRWNACVRKNYGAAVGIAKSQRKENKSEWKSVVRHSVTQNLTEEDSDGEMNWVSVLKFLRSYKQEHSQLVNRLRQLEREHEGILQEMQQVQTHRDLLEHQLYKLQEEHECMTEDYKTIVLIMERARKMTVFDSEIPQNERPRFRMDGNGNLERVE